MEQVVVIRDDDSIMVYPASEISLVYSDGSESWSAYEIAGNVLVSGVEYIYLASDLAGAVAGADSLAASTGPTGALKLLQEPEP